MAIEKRPICPGKRAGVRAGGLLRTIAAAPAVVRHLVDVRTPGSVGLGGNDSTVGKKGHSYNVGRRDPFIAVGIGINKPFIDRLGRQAVEQRKIGQHHQTRNVMGVTVFDYRAKAVAHTVHIGVGGPVEIGQRVRGIEREFLWG